MPTSYVAMICGWFGTEITQLRYDRLLCSVISALGFEPRNRRFGEAVARCWDGCGWCHFASVLSWVCKWDKQYSVVELGCSCPSTVCHIAVLWWFPLLDSNHGIGELENLKLDAEVITEEVNLHDCCSVYNCLTANIVRSLDSLSLSIRIKDVYDIILFHIKKKINISTVAIWNQ